MRYIHIASVIVLLNSCASEELGVKCLELQTIEHFSIVYHFKYNDSNMIDSVIMNHLDGRVQVIDYEYADNGKLKRTRIKGGEIIADYDQSGILDKKYNIDPGLIGITKYIWEGTQLVQINYGWDPHGSEPYELRSTQHFYYDSSENLVDARVKYFKNGEIADSVSLNFQYSEDENHLFKFKNELIPYFDIEVLMKHLPEKKFMNLNNETIECTYISTVRQSEMQLNGCGSDFIVKLKCEQ